MATVALTRVIASSTLRYDVLEGQLWSEACIVDELTVDLSSVTFDLTHHDPVTNNIKTLKIHKYQYQASELLKYIAVAKPTPKFIVKLSDLTPEIIAQLKLAQNPRLALKRAVGNLFENIDSRLFHLSISKVLEVELQ
jgi:hypothetical protein